MKKEIRNLPPEAPGGKHDGWSHEKLFSEILEIFIQLTIS